MGIFGTWLQGQIDARSWDQRDAAREIGVKETSVHNWLHQDVIPGMPNLLRISKALMVPLDTVLDKAGYDVPHNGSVPSSDELARRRAEVLAELPQYAEIIDLMARKPRERQAAYIDVIRRVLLDPQE